MENDELFLVVLEINKLMKEIDMFLLARKKANYSSPAEAGLVKARSLILSRELVKLRKMNLSNYNQK